MAGRSPSMSAGRSDSKSRSPRGGGGRCAHDEDCSQKKAELHLRHAETRCNQLSECLQMERGALNTAEVSLSSREAMVEQHKTKQATSIMVAQEAWKAKDKAEREARTALEEFSQAEEARQKAEGKVGETQQHQDIAAGNLERFATSSRDAKEAEQNARAEFDVAKENQRKAHEELATADAAKKDAEAAKSKCQTASSESEAKAAQAQTKAAERAAGGDPTGEPFAVQATAAAAEAKRVSQQANTALKDAKTHATKQQSAHDEAMAICKKAEDTWKRLSAEFETSEKQLLTAQASFRIRQRDHEEAVDHLEATKTASSRTSSNAKTAQDELELKQKLAETRRAEAEADSKSVAEAEQAKETAIALVNTARQKVATRCAELMKANEARREAEERVNSFIFP